MSVWNNIKALMFPDTGEEGVITKFEKSLAEVKEMRKELEQPPKTDMERILDAMKASMHEEGRWKTYEDKFVIGYKNYVTKEVKWLGRTSCRLVDEKTGWGLVCSFNYNNIIRHKDGSVFYAQGENTRNHTTEETNTTLWPYIAIGKGCVTTLEKRRFVPTKEQLEELLEYYEENIAKPLRDTERRVEEKQEIDVLKQMYLREE